MGFASDMNADQAYVNGIGRFDITVNSADAQVTWSKNGKQIGNDVSMLKFEKVVDGTKRALIVKNVTKDDFATYAAECDGAKKEAKLTQMSAFVAPIRDVEGYRGDIAVFECQVTPGSIVTWFANGKKINRLDFSILKFEERTQGVKALLIVKNITSADFCKFTAEARGEKCDAKLTEQSPFLGKMDAVSGLAGDIEVFMVQVQPGTHVSWSFGSKKINKQNFSILKYEERWVGNFRELVVKNINKADVGEYSVQARGTTQKAKLSTTADKTQTTTALRSKAGPRKELVAEKKATKVAAPKMTVTKVQNTDAFSKAPQSIDGKDGGIEVFECTMKDASAPCDWYRNNKKIEAANYSILKYEASVDGANRKLIVKNIRRQDVGEYVCKSGESAVTIKLTVGARGASGATLKVGDLGLKRRGSFSNQSKENAIFLALEKAKKSNKKWIRHPNYLNLWIMNPDFVAA